MATNQPINEAEQRYIQCMGQELGPLFFKLYNEVVWLFVQWKEYVDLFGTDPTRVDLLNKTAPLFFKIVQDVFFQNTLLWIARLTDPPTSCGKQNLTIQCLPDFMPDEEKGKIIELVDRAKEKADFCRDWRNRHIAHKDLKLIMGKGAEALKPASRIKVKDAIDAIAAVLNAVDGYYANGSIMFDMVNAGSGAESLLYVLKKSS